MRNDRKQVTELCKLLNSQEELAELALQSWQQSDVELLAKSSAFALERPIRRVLSRHAVVRPYSGSSIASSLHLYLCRQHL
jgi:hypothetical protein